MSVQLFETNHLAVNLCWMLLNCWLFTGLFITAHDCMPNLVVPRRQDLNRFIGQCSLYLYAGLQYDILHKGHTLHHQYTATNTDPDYLHQDSSPKPVLAFKWYLSFLRSYLTLAPFTMDVRMVYSIRQGSPCSSRIYALLLDCPTVVQHSPTFYFGTYLPHRGEFEVRYISCSFQ